MAKKSTLAFVNDEMKGIIKDFENLAYKHGLSTVFTDYITLITCAISNSVDKLHFDEREQTYINIMKKYTQQEGKMFAEIHYKIIEILNNELYQNDVLGELYHALNLSNSWNGQFFTPIHIAHLMARMTLGNVEKEISEKGYITINEPTCGSGVMIIAAANAMFHNKFNPSQNMCVYAVDNDIRCVMMTYIQLSYLGIPAVVVHGDSLKVEEYSRFYTPIYILGGWLWRNPVSMTDKICEDDIKLSKMKNPIFELLEKEKRRKEYVI